MRWECSGSTICFNTFCLRKMKGPFLHPVKSLHFLLNLYFFFKCLSDIHGYVSLKPCNSDWGLNPHGGTGTQRSAEQTRWLLPWWLRPWASLVAQLVKHLPALRETWVWSLGWEDPLEKGTATHSRILAWRTPWTIRSMGSQRVGHGWVTFTFTLYETKLVRKKKMQRELTFVLEPLDLFPLEILTLIRYWKWTEGHSSSKPMSEKWYFSPPMDNTMKIQLLFQ